MIKNNIYGYYISGTDPHLSEYITERWQTRSYISGFTGSAGFVIVTQKKADFIEVSFFYIFIKNNYQLSFIEIKNSSMDPEFMSLSLINCIAS